MRWCAAPSAVALSKLTIIFTDTACWRGYAAQDFIVRLAFDGTKADVPGQKVP